MFLEAQPSTAGSLVRLIMSFVMMLAVLYFFVIRPQQRQQKEHQAMLNNLKKGDKVVTIGGIHGEITGLSQDVITLKIAEKTEIKISKSGISSVIKEAR